MQSFIKRSFLILSIILVCIVPSFASDFILGDFDNQYLLVDNTPPTGLPFVGEYFITGKSGNTFYTILTGTPSGWGVDDSGYLVRLSGSATGHIYQGTVELNSTQLSAYSYPRYRTGSTGTNYTDLHITVTSSNVPIYASYATPDNRFGFTITDYLNIFLIGFIAVILLTKKR